MSGKLKVRWIAVAAALALTGCTDTTRAPELAKAGVATASALASYYDSLVQTSLDAWDMETFFSSITGVGLEKEQEDLLLRRIQALRLRADMARKLAGAYDALGDLAASKGGGAPDAAARLGASLQAIPGMPKSKLDPAGLFRLAAGKLTAIQQSRDLLAGSQAMAETLEKIHELVDQEAQVYQGIGAERDVDAEALTVHLIRNRMVPLWPALDRIPQLLRLPWQDQSRLDQDGKMTKAAVAMVVMQSRRLNMLSDSALGNLNRSLEGLAAKHRELAGHGQINLDDVLRTVRTAQSDLDEIDRLRGLARKPLENK